MGKKTQKNKHIEQLLKKGRTAKKAKDAEGIQSVVAQKEEGSLLTFLQIKQLKYDKYVGHYCEIVNSSIIKG